MPAARPRAEPGTEGGAIEIREDETNPREIETLITTYDQKLRESVRANGALLAQIEVFKLEANTYDLTVSRLF